MLAYEFDQRAAGWGILEQTLLVRLVRAPRSSGLGCTWEHGIAWDAKAPSQGLEVLWEELKGFFTAARILQKVFGGCWTVGVRQSRLPRLPTLARAITVVQT